MQPLLRTCLAFALLVGLSGLGHAPAQAAPEQTSYLLGEIVTTSPTGQPYGRSVALVKRVLKPDAHQIVEVVLQIEPTRPAAEFTTIFTVAGADFTLREQNGSFSGTGKLIGKPWAWTGWDYTVRLQGGAKGSLGGSLTGHDVLQGQELTVKKSYYGADGKLAALLAENYKPISAEMYAILHDRLFGAQPVPCGQ